MYMCMCIHIHTNFHVYIYMYLYIHEFTYMCTCVYIHTRMVYVCASCVCGTLKVKVHDLGNQTHDHVGFILYYL